jgi:type I restriction enzyme R subunit
VDALPLNPPPPGIVKIVREKFDKGNEFCQKITYKTTGKKTDELIAEFRSSHSPRIAVTAGVAARSPIR